MKTDEQLAYTVEEVANRLGLSRSSAYQAVHAGEIPSIRIGRRLLVPKRALEAMLCGPTILREGAESKADKNAT